MKILVVGGGGREHAIVKKLSESPRVKKLYAAPGNGGISQLAGLVPVKATDLDGLVKAARELAVDLVFVAPDDPLNMGLVDRLNAEGIRAFGPTAAAARLEGSKVFSKGLMKKYGIPTAAYRTFDNPADTLKYIKEQNTYPAVVKADGLALGKGAVIAEDYAAAEAAVKSIMEDRIFGESGARVVVEEFLTGPELTILAFADGRTISTMVSSQDHKRVYDGDRGPNTGGMGAFAPSPNYTPEIAERCMKEIFIPTVEAMAAENATFKGVIYFQLMLTPNGPKVIEYNARFGDPEAQVVLPMLKTDLVDIIDAVIDGRLADIDIEWRGGAAACVVAASGGYPMNYEKGFPISGLESIDSPDMYVYHAGTKLENGVYKTAGGRVLCVTAVADTLDAAVDRAYEGIAKIHFEGMHYRRDIGRPTPPKAD